jgi:hypothetical protein
VGCSQGQLLVPLFSSTAPTGHKLLDLVGFVSHPHNSNNSLCVLSLGFVPVVTVQQTLTIDCLNGRT